MLDRAKEDEFNSMLGIENDDPTVAFNTAGAELPDVAQVEEQEAVTQEAPAQQVDPFEERFSALEAKLNSQFETYFQRLQETIRPQQEEPRYQQPVPQPQQPPQFVPQRHLTDADLAAYHWHNQQVLQQTANELKQIKVNTEYAKLEAAKAQLKSTLGDDVFTVVPEDKINAAFQYAMANNRFDVQWADQLATVYWKVKGPEYRAKANEFAAKQAQKAEQAKQAQKAVPSGGNRFIPPSGDKPASSGRGFRSIGPAFEAELFGNG